MPIVSPLAINPLADGRQSDRAMIVRRGVQRLLAEHGAALLPELPLANGRRADLVAVTRRGDIWIVEIKTSIEDFRTDRKWPEYRLFCDRFFFATHPAVDQHVEVAAMIGAKQLRQNQRQPTGGNPEDMGQKPSGIAGRIVDPGGSQTRHSLDQRLGSAHAPISASRVAWASAVSASMISSRSPFITASSL